MYIKLQENIRRVPNTNQWVSYSAKPVLYV
jgi:hypothetical protein